MAQFGQQLRELRLKAGVSFQKSASYLGTTSSVIHDFESGCALPSKYQVIQLASCFEVDARDLLAVYQKQKMLNEEISERGEVTKSCLVKNEKVAAKRYQNMVRELMHLNKGKLHIEVHKPAPPLNTYIKNIIFYDGHNLGSSFEKVMPDGAVKLFIELDSKERHITLGDDTTSVHTTQNVWVTGIQKQHLSYQLASHQTMLSVEFAPGGFHALSDIPQTEMRNEIVNAYLIFGPSIIQLREEILEEKDTDNIFEKVHTYFKKRVPDRSTGYKVIAHVCNHIDQPLSSLVRKSGYSHKHLIDLFKKHIGITPKYFQRLARFKNVLNDIHSTRRKIDWTAIALDNNYFDQAHFIKEFKHFTGLSPNAYLETGSTCSKLLYLK